MRFSIEWNRMVDGNGLACGCPPAREDDVFNALDTLESALAGLGYRLVYTRREIVAQEGSGPSPDVFMFNGADLTDLLGADPSDPMSYTPDMIVRAAFAAVERDSD